MHTGLIRNQWVILTHPHPLGLKKIFFASSGVYDNDNMYNKNKRYFRISLTPLCIVPRFSYLINATLLFRQKRAEKYVSNSKTTWPEASVNSAMGMTAYFNEALATHCCFTRFNLKKWALPNFAFQHC